jgi:hypothetical protein
MAARSRCSAKTTRAREQTRLVKLASRNMAAGQDRRLSNGVV